MLTLLQPLRHFHTGERAMKGQHHIIIGANIFGGSGGPHYKFVPMVAQATRPWFSLMAKELRCVSCSQGAPAWLMMHSLSLFFIK